MISSLMKNWWWSFGRRVPEKKGKGRRGDFIKLACWVRKKIGGEEWLHIYIYCCCKSNGSLCGGGREIVCGRWVEWSWKWSHEDWLWHILHSYLYRWWKWVECSAVALHAINFDSQMSIRAFKSRSCAGLHCIVEMGEGWLIEGLSIQYTS